MSAPSGRVTAISIRQRQRHPRRPYRCSLCDERGHTAATCRLRGLSLWTNGCEIVIATSAADAVATWNDPIPKEDADLWTTPEQWTQVPQDPLELIAPTGKPVSWQHRAWIRMNGPCLLADAERKLEKGRHWE